MNKLLALLFVALFSGGSLFAQSSEFSAKDYDVLGTIPEIALDSHEAKLDLFYIFDRVFVEYIIDSERQRYFRWRVEHNLKYINDDNAIEDNNKLYIPLSSEKSIENLVVRVYKDGKLVSESLADELKTVELENRDIKLLALKGVEKGCIIETLIVKRLDLEGYDYEYFQDEVPRRNVEFGLYVPKDFRFRVRSYNGLKEAKVESGLWRRTYTLTQDSIPALEEEKYAFQDANRMRVMYTIHENTRNNFTFPRYEEMGSEFYGGIMKDYSKGRKAVKALEKKAALTEESGTKLLIYQIDHYLKTHLFPLPFIESASKLKKVIKQKVCSPRDYLRVYMYTFTKLNIEYEVVLTTSKTRRRFDPEFDTWNYLVDPIFYFPEFDIYLDPFERGERLGRINSDFLGQDALFCHPYMDGDDHKVSSKVKHIDKNKALENSDLHEITLTLSENLQGCKIDYRRRLNGYADMTLRSAYFSSDFEDREEFIKTFVKGDAEEAEVELGTITNYDMSKLDEYKEPFDISAKLTTSYYVESAGDKILIKVGELIGAQSEMYSESPRQQPMEIAYTHRYIRKIKIEIPEGYQAKGLDKLNIDIQYKNLAGEYSMGFTSNYKIEGNKVVIECIEYYNDLDYPLIQYDEFAKVINAAADFNKISILIEKKGEK